MREGQQALMGGGGMGEWDGSRWQVIGFMVMSLETSDEDKGEKDEKIWLVGRLGSGSEKGEEESCLCIVSTLE